MSIQSVGALSNLGPLLERLDRIDQTLNELTSNIRSLERGVESGRAFFTTEEVARILGKKPYTVREWCRLARINCTRDAVGRGGYGPYRISKDEITRIRDHGLLPLPRKK
jgi:hypothetical protein